MPTIDHPLSQPRIVIAVYLVKAALCATILVLAGAKSPLLGGSIALQALVGAAIPLPCQLAWLAHAARVRKPRPRRAAPRPAEPQPVWGELPARV